MRKIFFILCLLPLMAAAQTTKQKVLYMKAVRTNGSTTARLEGTEDFMGPIYNVETKRFIINGTSRTLNSIKEIRFEIREEEVPDAIENVEMSATEDNNQQTFDLSGRPVDMQRVQRGVYLKGGKKYIKK